MLFAFADVLHFGVVDGVDLVLVVPLLVDHPDEDADLLVVDVVILGFALKLTQQTTRYCPQFTVCLLRLPVVPGMAAEMLVAVEHLELACIALAHEKPLGGNLLDLPDGLLQQISVYRLCHVFLLDSGADDARVECPLVVIVIVDADILDKNHLHTDFTDALRKWTYSDKAHGWHGENMSMPKKYL